MSASSYSGNPYVGPRAFEEGEGGRFFGRERESEEIFHLLLARRLVLLHAPSGAGKSSLVRAALIPRLRDEGFLVRPVIRVGAEAVLSGGNRFRAATLLALDADRPPEARLGADALAALSLAGYLGRRPPPDDGEELLIFDQFEELISVDPADRAAKEAFIAELGALLENPRRWALFVLREDYLGALKPLLLPIPTRLAATYRLDLLAPDQARLAIQSPARAQGGEIEDDAVDKLIDDLRQTTVQRPDGASELVPGQAIEPVHIQVVCQRLWELQPTHLITVADIVQVGDVDTALRDYYAAQVAATAAASGVRERAIRDWVEGRLITAGGLRGQVLRQAGAAGDLDDAAIQALVRTHLLHAEERRGFTWYELAHDRLIGPVRADNAAWFAAHLSPLQRQARLWERSGRPEGLLLSDKELHQARRQPPELELSEDERAFLAASEGRGRQRRRRHVANLAIFALAISALGLLYGMAQFYVKAQDLAQFGVVQFSQLSTAEANVQAQLRRSEAHRLAFAAQSQIAIDAEEGLLLAYEASARDDSPVTEQTLRDAITATSWRPTLLRGQGTPVRSIAFSPDGQHILTAAADHTARLWDLQGQLLVSFAGHTDTVWSAAFSPDGQRIVTASDDGTARIWSLQGQALVTLQGHTDRVDAAIFSPDGAHILTGSFDQTARLWDLQGRELAVLTGHMGAVRGVTFSPDGRYILTASGDYTARLWDANTGRPLATLAGHRSAIWSALFSPDGSAILTASDDGTARLWDSTGQPLTTLIGHTGNVTSAVFSPDGTRILTASWDGTARLWGLQGQPLVTFVGHTDYLNSAVFSPDGTRILTASWDRTARLWDLQGQIRASLNGNAIEISHAIFSPDGSRILTASIDGATKLWEPQAPPLPTLDTHASTVRSVAFSPDGSRILTAADDGVARLWDSSGRELVALAGHTDSVSGATFSPDGSQILTSSWDGTVRLWGTDGSPLMTLGGKTIAFWKAIFSPDGRYILANATTDSTARLWDLRGRVVAVLEGHTKSIISMAFSPDGQHIITASYDGTARLWDLQGRELAVLTGHTGWVVGATFSPDGSRILTAADDGTARLWDATGQPLATLAGHTSSVKSALFSPDGKYILTASSDYTARLWDATGRPLHSLIGHTEGVFSAVFSPDGSQILTASYDGTARLWDATGQPLATLNSHTGALNSALFSPDGRRILTAGEDGAARQYLVFSADLRRAAACQIGRGLTQAEIERFLVPTPPAFDFERRQCPPVYSWQQGAEQ